MEAASVLVPCPFWVRLALPARETLMRADPVLVKLKAPELLVRVPLPVIVPLPRPSWPMV